MRSKFHLGEIVMTNAATQALQQTSQRPADFLDRHIAGDWGDIDDDTAQENNAALDPAAPEFGSRLFSAYSLSDGTQICIVTENGRQSTTICLADEVEQLLDALEPDEDPSKSQLLFFVFVDKETGKSTPIIDTEDGDQSQIVFTDPDLAQEYLTALGWDDHYQVGYLSPEDLLSWLVGAKEHGVGFIFLDPDSHKESQPALAIDGLLGNVSDYLADLLFRLQDSEPEQVSDEDYLD